MKIILVNVFLQSMGTRYMSSSYVLKAYYNANGLNVDNVNIEVLNFSSTSDPKEISQNILALEADVLGFSCYVWNREFEFMTIQNIREAGFDKHIIIGGPEVSAGISSDKKMCELIDYFVIGEGEIAFTHLIDGLFELETKSSPLSVLPAGVLHYNKHTNCVQYTPQTQRVDMAELPAIYSSGIVPKKLCKHAFIETQRGCKYKCKYCLYHKNLKNVTYRNIDDVKREISYLLTECRVNYIRIADPTFSSDLEYAKDILRLFVDLKERGYSVLKIMIEYEYHDIDEEYIELISRLRTKDNINNYAKTQLRTDCPIGNSIEITDGYTVLSGVGIQSFNNEALKAVSRRPIIDEEIERFFALCKRYNISLKLDMILGLPKETVSTYLSGLNRLMEYMEGTDHYFQSAFLMILPETALEKHSEEMGLHYNKETKIVYKTNEMAEDELRYCGIITAITYRIINSALRVPFYEAVNRTGKSCIDIIASVYDHMCDTLSEGKKADLYEYTESEVFSVLKHEDLYELLTSIYNIVL